MAVGQTLPQIRDWFESRNGNVNGIPVEHISCNIISFDFLQSQCDDFISDHSITLPANDYNSDADIGPVQTNTVHDSFTTPNTKPLFVIINCVADSPSHGQNVLLTNFVGQPGFGSQADWNAATAQWRAAIDSVQAPPPELATVQRLTNGGIRFSFPGQRGRTNQVLVSSDLLEWRVLASYFGTNGLIVFEDRNAQARRFYRVRRL